MFIFSLLTACSSSLPIDQPVSDQAGVDRDQAAPAGTWAETDARPDPARALIHATYDKLTPAYRQVVIGAENQSSLVYFSGPDRGMLELHSFPRDPKYQAVTVLKDGFPLVELAQSDGVALTEIADVKAEVRNNTGSRTLLDHYADEHDVTGSLASIVLFFGWTSVPVTFPEMESGEGRLAPGYLLAAPTNHSLMFIGLPKGDEIAVALLQMGEPELNADGQLELAYILDEIRSCTVPFWDHQGYAELAWSNCWRVR